MKDLKSKKKSKEHASPQQPAVARRDLMKMGVGASVVAMSQLLNVPGASAQQGARSSAEASGLLIGLRPGPIKSATPA